MSGSHAWSNHPRAVLVSIPCEEKSMGRKTEKDLPASVLFCIICNLGKKPKSSIIFRLAKKELKNKNGKLVSIAYVECEKKELGQDIRNIENWTKTPKNETEKKDTRKHRLLFHLSQKKDKGISSGELQNFAIENFQVSQRTASSILKSLRDEKFVDTEKKETKKVYKINETGLNWLESEKS